jgi:hypothetical protein
MNIFWLDKNLKKNAEYYVDSHVRKIILEITQLLSNVLHFYNIKAPYKPTHMDHPLSKWVRENNDNFDLTCEMGLILGDEFQFRFGKKHKCYDIIADIWEGDIENENEDIYHFLPQGKFNYWETYNIDFANLCLCMPDKYKTNDPIESYRNYYIGEKSHLFKWTKREKPEWIKEV